jgi:2-polyprenyl-6-methoxyphenol hydroxylase-like FAD-dependent oxidoreductase
LHSAVRAIAFGEESLFVKHMGYYIAIYTIPDFLDLGDTGRYFVQRGKRVGCFGRKDTGTAAASFYFASTRLDYDRRDADAQKRLLRETFADVKWAAPRMLDMLDAAPDFYFDSLSQVRMERWSAGRVVLLGDAAACASPVAGMGTSIAMVGAYVLAGEIRRAAGDYTTAFAVYETTMRHFVSEAQKMAGSVTWFVPQTRLKLWLSNKLWSWMPRASLRELMIEQPNRVAGLVALEDT